MVEMATALILQVGAGLMLRSLGNLWHVDPGFRPDCVVVANVTLPPAVLARSVRAALAGTALGIAAALPLTRLMGNLLYGVSATDPATFAGVVVVLVAVTLAASYLPPRRAMEITPASALSEAAG